MTSIRTFRAAVSLTALAVSLVLIPAQSEAQRRGAPRIRALPGRVAVMRAYYAPLFYDPWFSPFGYGWYPPYAFAGAYRIDSSLRLQVAPRETEVFVDGYFAGTVDDFDGFFQRLRLEPGEHEVTLYLPGHRTATQNVYLQPGRTFRIRHTMEPLPPGAQPEARPAAPLPERRAPAPPPLPPRGPGAPPATGSDPSTDRAAQPAGAIAIRVQPSSAQIFIDGEQWEGPGASEQLVVQVAAGMHRIEVRSDGYETYSGDVNVRPGETSAINISLSRRQ